MRQWLAILLCWHSLGCTEDASSLPAHETTPDAGSGAGSGGGGGGAGTEPMAGSAGAGGTVDEPPTFTAAELVLIAELSPADFPGPPSDVSNSYANVPAAAA